MSDRNIKTGLGELEGWGDKGAGLEKCLREVQRNFPEEEEEGRYALEHLLGRYHTFEETDITLPERMDTLVWSAAEFTSRENPRWEFVAARPKYCQSSMELQDRLGDPGITYLYEKLRYLTEQGLYGDYILKHCGKQEIEQAEGYLCEGRNHLFTYTSLDLLLKCYVVQDYSRRALETSQEIYLGIALHLTMEEDRNGRMEWVRQFYDMLSLMQVTMATPTLSNTRKPYHQLSSCSINTVPDSLEGTYRSVDNFAQVNKFDDGTGLYFGKVRATGSDMRGFRGMAGGVIHWIKLVNDTAVAVDQLGMRQGAAIVYLDVWHKDLPKFLQPRTNNGDDRTKAHDISPGACYPGLLWKMAKESLDQDWYLMCPHEIKAAKGYYLEDSYGAEWEERYWDCAKDRRISKRTVLLKDVVRVILKSAVETGAPFAFNGDLVNGANPSSHKGTIYCSNLYTEIAQSMETIETVPTGAVDQDGGTVIMNATRAGGFMVCNLASLYLRNIDVTRGRKVEEIVSRAARVLDNVIDLNFYPLPYVEMTDRRYRNIGLGVSGYHHMLARHDIRWENEEYIVFADQVFERVSYTAVKASGAIGAERGSYTYFQGSRQRTGEYFEKRGYVSGRRRELARTVAEQGMRNAYLMAVTPTSSTSILSGTTADLNPVTKRFYLEEKKNSIIPRVAPKLTMGTSWLYKGAYTVDQTYTVRAAGAHQRHIDQMQSVNLYITNGYTMRQLLNLYVLAWEQGVKTLYCVCSRSLEVEECEDYSS